jgi:AhpD family alkylhydroperoxidase
MEHQGKWLEAFLACRKHYDNEGAEVWQHTLQSFEAAFKDGAIGAKEKHLMAVCLGIGDHCAPCTLGHLQAAIAAGADRQEILETVGVALSMGGTTAMGGAWRVFQRMTELGMFPETGPDAPEKGV